MINKLITSLSSKLIYLIFVVFLFYPKPALASSWIYSGLDRNTIGFIKISPASKSEIYCNSTSSTSPVNYDLFKSINYGLSWFSVVQNSTGLPINPEIRTIALHPSNHNIIFAGVYNKGIYKSIDGGNTWTNLNFLTPGDWTNRRLTALTIDPNNPSIIYAGLGNNNCVNGGLYKSVDGGSSWTELPIPSKCDLSHITLDYTNTNNIYASGTESYKSIDGGFTWTKMSIIRVSELVIDVENSNILYAAQVTNPFGFYSK